MRYIKPEPYYEVAGEFEFVQAETHVSNTYKSNISQNCSFPYELYLLTGASTVQCYRQSVQCRSYTQLSGANEGYLRAHQLGMAALRNCTHALPRSILRLFAM